MPPFQQEFNEETYLLFCDKNKVFKAKTRLMIQAMLNVKNNTFFIRKYVTCMYLNGEILYVINSL